GGHFRRAVTEFVAHYNDVSYCLTWLCGRSRRETEGSLFSAWYCALSSPAPNTGHQRRDRWRFQIVSLEHPRALRQRMVPCDLAALDGQAECAGIDAEHLSGFSQIHPSF